MNLNISEKKFKKLIIIPLLLIVISMGLLAVNYMNTGTLLQRSIDLQGGTQITLHYSEKPDIISFENTLKSNLGATDANIITTTSPTSGRQETLVVSVAGDIPPEQIVEEIQNFLGITLEPTTYSVRSLGSSIASTFWIQVRNAFLFAFILMILVVTYFFRSIAPASAILLAISADIVVILGFMSLFGINLSLATMAAILMIIGYGTDSNVLLSQKLVKEKEGNAFDRLLHVIPTGIAMSATTLCTMAALFIFATNALVLRQIASVLLIGLTADLLNTWVLNANLLLWRQN